MGSNRIPEEEQREDRNSIFLIVKKFPNSMKTINSQFQEAQNNIAQIIISSNKYKEQK